MSVCLSFKFNFIFDIILHTGLDEGGALAIGLFIRGVTVTGCVTTMSFCCKGLYL